MELGQGAIRKLDMFLVPNFIVGRKKADKGVRVVIKFAEKIRNKEVILVFYTFFTSMKSGVGNLRFAWTFNMARIRIFVTQVRTQHSVQTR